MTHGRHLEYDYDAAGNQITRTIANAPVKGWTLTWDLESGAALFLALFVNKWIGYDIPELKNRCTAYEAE